MHRYTITIPRHYNTGAVVEPAVIESLEAAMLDVFGGFTVTEARGAWQDGGTVYVEPVGVYVLDADESQDGAVEHIAENVATLLAQEAVYVTHTAPDGSQDRSFVGQPAILA